LAPQYEELIDKWILTNAWDASSTAPIHNSIFANFRDKFIKDDWAEDSNPLSVQNRRKSDGQSSADKTKFN